MPREVLLQQCLSDQALIGFICKAAQTSAKPDVLNRTMLSFYAVILCEALAHKANVGEDTVALLYPYLSSGLQRDVFSDLRAASIMILSKLAARVPLSVPLLTELLDDVARSSEPRDTRMLALLLTHVAASQIHLTRLSTRFLKACCKLPSFIDDLVSVSKEAPSACDALMRLTTSSMCTSLQKDLALSTHLIHIICNAPIDVVAVTMAVSLIQTGIAAAVSVGQKGQAVSDIMTERSKANKARDGGLKDVCVRVLRALEQRYPAEVDAAVNQLLQQHRSMRNTVDSDEDVQGSDENLESSKERSRLFEFVSEVFQGGLHAPTDDGAITLSLAVNAPAATVRLEAVKRMGALLLRTDLPGSSRAVAESALLNRLSDDDWEVVGAVLSVEALPTLPSAALLDALKDVMCRLEAALGGAGADLSAPRAAAQKTVRLLSRLVQLSPHLHKLVLPYLLPHLLVSPSTRKISLLTLEEAHRIPNPLFAHLSPPAKSNDVPSAGNAHLRSPAELNISTICSLATALQGNPILATELVEAAASTTLRGSHLVLLTLLYTCSSSTSTTAATHAAATSILSMLLPATNPSATPSSQQLPLESLKSACVSEDWPEVSSILFTDDKLPTAAHTKQVQKDFLTCHSFVQLHALRAALRFSSLPTTDQDLQIWFSSLAALRPTSVILPHLHTLLSRIAPDKSLSFLTEQCLCVSNDSTAAAAVHLTTSSVSSGAADTHSLLTSILPTAFALLSSSSATVRAEAVSLLDAIIAKLPKQAQDASTPTGSKAKAAKANQGAPAFPALPIVRDFLVAVSEHRGVITADARACSAVVTASFNKGPSVAIKHGKASRNSSSQSGDSSIGPIALSVPEAVLNAGRQLLLLQLQHLTGKAATPGALCLLSCLQDGTAPTSLLTSAFPQLARILALPASSLSSLDSTLATKIISLIRHDTCESVPESAALLISLLSPPSASADAPLKASQEIRAAAFRSLTCQLYDALPQEEQQRAFHSLLSAAASDVADACREAAVSCLEAITVNAALIAPLLVLDMTPSSVQDLHKKKKRKASNVAAPQDTVSTSSTPLSRVIDALQLVQWKDPILQFALLLPPLQTVISSLLPHVSSMAVAHAESDVVSEDVGSDSPDGTLAGYAVQLALLAVTRLVDGDSAAAVEVDLSLVVRCAQKAPDAAIRNAALLLITKVSSLIPEKTLNHVLEVVAVVHQSAAIQEDSYSAKVTSTALSAVVPAWLQSGRPPSQLWENIISTLPSVPSHRRLPLLSTLLGALPQESGLPLALLHLLQQITTVKSKKKSSANTPQPQDAVEDVGHDTWSADLASALTAQVPPSDRLAAFALVMEHSVADGAAHVALPRTAVAFVTAELKMKSVQAEAQQLLASESGEKLDLLLQSGKKLLHQSLSQLQLLNRRAAEKSGSKKAMQSSSAGLYKLLAALEGVLPAALYIQALVDLQSSDAVEGLRRRTLRLFASKIESLEQEIQDLDIIAPATKEARVVALTSASLALLPHLPAFVHVGAHTATTRQAALIAVDALARQFGPSRPSTLVASLPTIITACKDPSVAVQGSALSCIAAIISTASRKIVPHLPLTVNTVIDAATTAAAAIATSSDASDEDTDSDKEVKGDEEVGSGTEKEQQAFKLSAALAAVEAMVQHLGALMSPYTSAIARLLLQPHVLNCSVANCSKFAERVQRRLPEALPPRLLFDPLFGLLPDALESGGPAVVEALLQMVGEATSAMDAKVASTYFDRVFSFLLRALDVRQLHPALLAATPGGIARVEQCAVSAIVTLVMKLSESKFKPLFLRLMEWANSVPPPSAAQPDGEAAATSVGPSLNLGRMCSMMALVEALTKRLRSVFVPYYRYLLDICIHFLSSTAVAQPRPKKKRKQAADVTPAKESSSASSVDVETTWVLRLKIVRCLHRCFLSDSVGFLVQEKFDRLLPPLVAQLDSEVPEDVAGSVYPQCADEELDGSVKPGAKVELDMFGRAVVACLTQMAVTAGSDAMWKPLNQQALMMTRNAQTRTRLLGLEVTAQLIDRVREDFLVLLPETIPFLAELLEDTDSVVEGRAQEVIRVLEDVSGEKLEQYLK